MASVLWVPLPILFIISPTSPSHATSHVRPPRPSPDAPRRRPPHRRGIRPSYGLQLQYALRRIPRVDQREYALLCCPPFFFSPPVLPCRRTASSASPSSPRLRSATWYLLTSRKSETSSRLGQPIVFFVACDGELTSSVNPTPVMLSATSTP